MGQSLFYTFQLQRSEDFHCEYKHQSFSNSVSNDDCVSEYLIIASNARLVDLIWHN